MESFQPDMDKEEIYGISRPCWNWLQQLFNGFQEHVTSPRFRQTWTNLKTANVMRPCHCSTIVCHIYAIIQFKTSRRWRKHLYISFQSHSRAVHIASQIKPQELHLKRVVAVVHVAEKRTACVSIGLGSSLNNLKGCFYLFKLEILPQEQSFTWINNRWQREWSTFGMRHTFLFYRRSMAICILILGKQWLEVNNDYVHFSALPFPDESDSPRKNGRLGWPER